jgi:putative ABC transport system substrate-binding protein
MLVGRTNRRAFIVALGATAALPFMPSAQQLEKMPRVGVLVTPPAPHPFAEAFRSGMRDLGYSEGHNITIEWRYADASFSRAVGLAEELVRLQVYVIAALHTPAMKAAMNATGTQQTPETLGALVKAGAEKWWPIINKSGIKGE